MSSYMTYDEMDPSERAAIHGNAHRVHGADGEGLPAIYADEDGARRDRAAIDAAWEQGRASGENPRVTMGKVHEAAERLYLAGMVASYRHRQADPTTRRGSSLVIVDQECYLAQAVSMGSRAYGWHEPYVYAGETDPMDE
jgi:hypothetical protein